MYYYDTSYCLDSMPPILDDMLVLNEHTIDWHKTFFATDGHEYEIICYKFSDMSTDQR